MILGMKGSKQTERLRDIMIYIHKFISFLIICLFATSSLLDNNTEYRIPALVHMLPDVGNHIVHPDHTLMRMGSPAAVVEGHTLLRATLLYLRA